MKVDRAREVLRAAPTVSHPGCTGDGRCGIHGGQCFGAATDDFDGLRDLRGQEVLPGLAEASAREGIPFLTTVTGQDGREKVVLQGAPPGLVRRFLAGEIVPGLTNAYGDPARGFAGGYIAP